MSSGRLSVLLAGRTRREGDCIRWTGAHTPKGYGSVRADGKTRALHRVVYELSVGPIPDGLEIDHRCRVRDCVEVTHLEPVTHAENLRRRKPPPDHCPQGHPFTPENTSWSQSRQRPKPTRRCRTCKQARNAARPSRARKEPGRG